MQRVIRHHFNESCEIYYLGSRVIGIADDEESDLDFFIDMGETKGGIQMTVFFKTHACFF
jgi:hypothetical protein